MEIVTRAGLPSPLTISRFSSFACAALTRANSVAATSGASVAIRQSSATPPTSSAVVMGSGADRAGAHLGRRES